MRDALWLPLAALAVACARGGAPDPPWDGDEPLRFLIESRADARGDAAASVEVDFARMLEPLGATHPGRGTLRAVEVGSRGEVLDAAVPWQIDALDDRPGSTLTLWLAARGAGASPRRCLVYFGLEDRATPPPAPVLVTVEDDALQEGRACMRVKTPVATWVYDRAGGGFASLLDAQGHDWIAWSQLPGSAGSYRGIPNLVFPEGYFHPGGSDCTSRLERHGPVTARIVSSAEDGAWSTAWDIYPSFARLTVLRAPRPYWFLYEGTPGGQLDAADRVVVATGDTPALSESWDRDLRGAEWALFSDVSLGRGLLLVNHEDDGFPDSYRPMEGNMTVFGFGRSELRSYLRKTPASFSVALGAVTDRPGAEAWAAAHERPPRVRVGPLQSRPR